MNCNQLIALLEIYRTGHPPSSRTDLTVLEHERLVKPISVHEYQTTEKGNIKVRAILALI